MLLTGSCFLKEGMNFFKVTNVSEALQGWELIKQRFAMPKEAEPDFSFISPTLLGIVALYLVYLRLNF